MITFLANNFDHLNMDSLIQEKINRARAWEAAFVSFLKNYTESNDKPDFMDGAFSSASAPPSSQSQPISIQFKTKCHVIIYLAMY